MNATANHHNWKTFLKLFNEQNKWRPTRLGILEKNFAGVTTDSWIENGLPLSGIDLDFVDKKTPTIEILLGDAEKPDSRHLTHIVSKVRIIKIILSVSGAMDGLEIEDDEGKTTMLHFES